MLLRSMAIMAVAVGMSLTLPPAAIAYPAQTTGDLNVRSGPGVRHARIGVLPRHTVVNVRHCQSRWCQIDFRGRVAWASASYLAGVQAVGPGPVYGYPRAVRPYYGRRIYPQPYFGWPGYARPYGYPRVVRPYYGGSYRYRRPGVSVYFGTGFGGGWFGF